MHDWQTTLLALCFLASTAAFFIVWSKYEDQKQKTAEEHNAYRNALEYGNAIAEALKEESSRRWDEISRAVGLENEIEQLRKQCEAKDYAKQRMSEVNSCLRSDKAILQDHLSTILCPHNDHIWKDGFCAKCGRAKDALS